MLRAFSVHEKLAHVEEIEIVYLLKFQRFFSTVSKFWLLLIKIWSKILKIEYRSTAIANTLQYLGELVFNGEGTFEKINFLKYFGKKFNMRFSNSLYPQLYVQENRNNNNLLCRLRSSRQPSLKKSSTTQSPNLVSSRTWENRKNTNTSSATKLHCSYVVWKLCNRSNV